VNLVFFEGLCGFSERLANHAQRVTDTQRQLIQPPYQFGPDPISWTTVDVDNDDGGRVVAVDDSDV